MSERDEFEAWFVDSEYGPRRSDGDSIYHAAKAAFWAGRWSLQKALIPTIPDGSIGAESFRYNALLDHAERIGSRVATEHAHDWRFSLQDHVYKCDCGATRGDYPFGAASFKD